MPGNRSVPYTRSATGVRNYPQILLKTPILAAPDGTLIHQATFRVSRMCSWPLLQAFDTVCGVHSPVEPKAPGAGTFLGHLSLPVLVLQQTCAEGVS